MHHGNRCQLLTSSLSLTPQQYNNNNNNNNSQQLADNEQLFHGNLCYITFITHKNDVIISVEPLFRATSSRRVAL